MNKENIKELVTQTMEAMQNMGLTTYTVWNNYGQIFQPIIKQHALQGKEQFDREIITEYMSATERRYEKGEISTSTYQKIKRGMQRLTEMHDVGKLEWSASNQVSRYILNEYYEKILADFIPGENVSAKAKKDILWVGRKYFSWLITEGHAELSGVGAREVQGFMIHCSNHMVSSGIHNVKIYMRKLYRYLVEKEYSSENYDGLLSFPVSRESRLSPATPPGEIAETLDVIDKRTPQGKRDYAMVLLGTVCGLRAIDIAKIKLCDIDWKKGEIKIVQSKTLKSLALPLTKDVGEAVSDYILNVRPKTAYENIFLRFHAPFRPFADGTAVGDIYDYYRKRAGLPRDAYDGKGFHSLRRSLGKNLITSGAPVTMTAQILGDYDINSTKKYIALDSEHLKECALDFTGIKPKRGVMTL